MAPGRVAVKTGRSIILGGVSKQIAKAQESAVFDKCNSLFGEYVMLLAFSTWPEIDARLKRSRTVVIPVGSNEQHGPTGLIGTDWLCPEIIAHEAERGATY